MRTAQSQRSRRMRALFLPGLFRAEPVIEPELQAAAFLAGLISLHLGLHLAHGVVAVLALSGERLHGDGREAEREFAVRQMRHRPAADDLGRRTDLTRDDLLENGH